VVQSLFRAKRRIPFCLVVFSTLPLSLGVRLPFGGCLMIKKAPGLPGEKWLNSSVKLRVPSFNDDNQRIMVLLQYIGYSKESSKELPDFNKKVNGCTFYSH
jgi:hypothetical protein